MSRSSEILFFSTDIGCLGECFKLLFLSFLGRGAVSYHQLHNI